MTTDRERIREALTVLAQWYFEHTPHITPDWETLTKEFPDHVPWYFQRAATLLGLTDGTGQTLLAVLSPDKSSPGAYLERVRLFPSGDGETLHVIPAGVHAVYAKEGWRKTLRESLVVEILTDIAREYESPEHLQARLRDR